MENKIELNKYILDLVKELERYYFNGDKEDLEAEQWLREVEHLNKRIASEVMHLTREQIPINKIARH